MSAASGSSSAAPYSKESYDVFISFRGQDTRRNFVSHLDAALCQKEIKTYKDDRTLEKGDEVWPALVQAIDNSHLCIVVFSKHYASSTWCLRELTHILGCKKERQVLPVFYQIDPSHIRKQIGSYKDAFDKHEKDHKLDEKTVREWRNSLKKAADFSGFDSESHLYRDENHLIVKIVEIVWKKLAHIYPQSEPKGLIGIEKSSAHMDMLLRNFQTIGLWGMGGIGKTTTAKIAFSKHFSEYESHCFLEDIREKSGNLGFGLYNLRKRLLAELLKGENIDIDGEFAFVKSRLSYKTVFIVLDDVDTAEQVEFLVEDINCFGPGSRIIITTRDRHVLNGRVDKIYEVKELNFQESLQLFSFNAFGKEHPQMKFEMLSREAVNYAQGLPLALKLLGSYLYSRGKEAWESALQKLKKYPYEPIDKVLKLSYDGLDEEERNIFLDIAFFFKGREKKFVKRFLNACGFDATIGLEVLEDKCLVTISNDDIVEMHDLIQEMGWKRVHEESLKNPGRRSRLRNPKEIYDVLKNNTGSDVVEGILLDLCAIDDLHLSGDAFQQMTRLRFLKFYHPFSHLELRKSVVYPSGLETFSNSLRYFIWDGYPMECLPQTLCIENLVLLAIQDSPIKILGDRSQDFINLKEIYLSGCNQLIELPNFSKAFNLEVISLQRNENLRYVPTFCAESLVYLNLSKTRIKKCWDGVLNLVNLEAILLDECKELIDLPDLSRASNLKYASARLSENLRYVPTFCAENLVYLNLSKTRIKKCWDGVLNLVNLKGVWLDECKKLIELPDLSKASKLKYASAIASENLCHLHPSLLALHSLLELRLLGCHNLKSLQSVTLSNNLELILPNIRELNLAWTSIRTLPSSIGGCVYLERLRIFNSALESLPSSIKDLPRLLFLEIRNCMRLRYLPEIPPSLAEFNAENCPSLETVSTPSLSVTKYCLRERLSSSVKPLSHHIRFANCLKLDESSLHAIQREAYRRIKLAATCQCDRVFKCSSASIAFYFPGNSLPWWIRYEKIGRWITVELSPRSDLLGFAFCLIFNLELLYQGEEGYWIPGMTIACTCYLDDSKILESSPYMCCRLDSDNRINLSDHVVMWYDEHDSEVIVKAIEDTTPKHTSYNPKLTFLFSVLAKIDISKEVPDLGSYAIKKCGVWPIYGQKEMEVSRDHKTNKWEDIDILEASPIGITMGGSEFHHKRNDSTEINFNSVLNCERIALEYQYSIDQMELPFKVCEEQLPLTKSFRESTFQTVVPMALELDLNTEAKTHLEIEKIEVGNSYHESQESLLQTEEFISRPHTTPTEMQNDYRDFNETFSCGSFIGILWKLLSRLISAS